jgi:hypothetical protein
MIWAVVLPETQARVGLAAHGRKQGKGACEISGGAAGANSDGGDCDACRPCEQAARDGTNHLIASRLFLHTGCKQ